MRTTGLLLLVCIVTLAIASLAVASVPPMINYQGKLMQPNGTPMPDGEYRMAFAIYGQPTGGTALWSETNEHVQVKGGLYGVLLGSVINLPANIFDAPDRYFGVKVGNDPETTPRQQAASVPYALSAGNGVPPGTIVAFGASTPPAGWRSCNGQAISRTTYSALFAAIGTTFGAGDGSTTFNLPNLTDRFPIGYSGTKAIGTTGGEAAHTLTIAEIPAHTHVQNAHNHTAPNHSHNLFSPGELAAAGSAIGAEFVRPSSLGGTNRGNKTESSAITINSTTATNQNTGGGAAHNNLPPYQAVKYMIKY